MHMSVWSIWPTEGEVASCANYGMHNPGRENEFKKRESAKFKEMS